MATDLTALKAAVKLLADAAVDTEQVVAAGGNPLAAVITYRNLIPDLAALLPQIGDVTSEAAELAPDDYVALVGELAKDLAITDAHAGEVVGHAMELISTLVGSAAPQLLALIDAVKKPA